jgi:hypothetical protein
MPFDKDFNISTIIGNYVSLCLKTTAIIGKYAQKGIKNGFILRGSHSNVVLLFLHGFQRIFQITRTSFIHSIKALDFICIKLEFS